MRIQLGFWQATGSKMIGEQPPGLGEHMPDFRWMIVEVTINCGLAISPHIGGRAENLV